MLLKSRYWLGPETHKELKCVTVICLPCPMLVNIHFRKYHIWNEKKTMRSILLGMVAVLGKIGLPPRPKPTFWNLIFIIYGPCCHIRATFSLRESHATRVSKCGQNEYVRALNASYGFLLGRIRCTSPKMAKIGEWSKCPLNGYRFWNGPKLMKPV